MTITFKVISVPVLLPVEGAVASYMNHDLHEDFNPSSPSGVGLGSLALTTEDVARYPSYGAVVTFRHFGVTVNSPPGLRVDHL